MLLLSVQRVCCSVVYLECYYDIEEFLERHHLSFVFHTHLFLLFETNDLS